MDDAIETVRNVKTGLGSIVLKLKVDDAGAHFELEPEAPGQRRGKRITLVRTFFIYLGLLVCIRCLFFFDFSKLVSSKPPSSHSPSVSYKPVQELSAWELSATCPLGYTDLESIILAKSQSPALGFCASSSPLIIEEMLLAEHLAKSPTCPIDRTGRNRPGRNLTVVVSKAPKNELRLNRPDEWLDKHNALSLGQFALTQAQRRAVEVLSEALEFFHDLFVSCKRYAQM